ncbi:MAG: hypothetical protein COV52_04820 [Gammaproteobacteria bacterium CG11_big_fil_rev_8_21_14_0_20_46_22]|nr:MAG: hypothetical protein COW05_02905 [Gammaproteobacteria bacterium CG12_big_fil_rev_8_21_14_0_65_46_12]PIR11264.1 MAG: hypothetical protein COV52_04820 [Gammaproteobacteria bacterium CG11_big_fil_rev_8_21_14_0_20_46_22]
MRRHYFRQSSLFQLDKGTPAHTEIQPETNNSGALYLGMAPLTRSSKWPSFADLRMLQTGESLSADTKAEQLKKIKASKPYLLSSFAGAFCHHTAARYQRLAETQGASSSPLVNTNTIVVSFLTDEEYGYQYHDGSGPTAKPSSSNFFHLPLEDKTCRFREKQHSNFARKLISNIETIYTQQTEKKKTVYFHCNVGVGRSLMGCAAYLAYTRLKGQMDSNEKPSVKLLRDTVFEAFKDIKRQRPQVKFPRHATLRNSRVNFVVNCFKHSRLYEKFIWPSSELSPLLRR